MENTNNKDHVRISLEEYRALLSQAANYAMLLDVIKAGVKLGYAQELTIAQSAIDVILKYVLGAAYGETVEALKSEEA